jgi:uncharacterized protein YyaL (SSP411 family)
MAAHASDAKHSGQKPNRLIDSTSPYLLQHAYNPVDWHPWSSEAIERAKSEDKPIFLSIGYSACHWCHVMEREVFENPDIAKIMNDNFINIKVDREERPDLDELYMLATQLMSGSGGWPMSVWLTPTLEPFYAGTYFPATDNYGRPGFPRLELAITDAWKNRRAELLGQSKKVVEAIRMHADESAGIAGSDNAIDLKAWFAGAMVNTADRFDPVNGGLGSAPKFPPHQTLHLWLAMLRHPNAAQLAPKDIDGLRDMTTKTLDAMMHGGIYDHVGGAFARYSTDEKWLVPHFEKMLYDNAQLAPAYALAAAQFHRPDYARIARQTLDFWLREMTGESAPGQIGGGFHSTLDADSEGEEGKFYVWTQNDIRAALPNADDANLIIEHLGVTEHGNWHESPVENACVLSIIKPIPELLENKKLTGKFETQDALQRHIDSLFIQMRAFRAKRIPPGLDDKVLTSWNGLMISALAISGRLLKEPRYLEAAHRAMGFLLTQHMEGGRRLLRVSRAQKDKPGTKAHTDGFLEDHAFLLNGLMDLVDATLPTSLPGTMARKRALELADTLIRNFSDKEKGGFFFTATKHDTLFARMKNAADNATPSANAMAIRALLRLARSSGKEQYREAAMDAVHAFTPNIARRPDYFPTILQSLLEDADARAHHQSLAAADMGAAPIDDLNLSDGRDLPIALEEPTATRTDARFKLTVLEIPPVTDRAFHVRLELTIAEGFHIQPNRPLDRENFATVARLRGELNLAAQDWSYPPTDAEKGYSGKVTFMARCTLPENVTPGRYNFRATVLAQPCAATSCLAPEKVSVDFPVVVR